MKSAKEMWVEMGYTYIETSSYIYIKDEEELFFAFDKVSRIIYIEPHQMVSNKERKVNKYTYEFGMEELQAINKQVEELGWK